MYYNACYEDYDDIVCEQAMTNLFLAANDYKVFKELSPAYQRKLIDILAAYTKLNINCFMNSNIREAKWTKEEMQKMKEARKK